MHLRNTTHSGEYTKHIYTSHYRQVNVENKRKRVWRCLNEMII